MVGSMAKSRQAPTGRTAEAGGRSARRSSQAFRCPQCKREYGDPWYHGPIGHAPQRLCFDCWASEWAMMNQVMARGGNWQQLDAALFLLCQGFTHQEAGDLIGVTRRTLVGWIRELRRRPTLTPEWLIDLARSREAARR